MKPRLDSLYIYLQKERSPFNGVFDEIDQRHYESDFKFLRGNVPDTAEDVYRYAKTVEINDIRRTFVIVTLESDTKKIEAFFDESLKTIKKDAKLMRKFSLAKPKPTDTSIVYAS